MLSEKFKCFTTVVYIKCLTYRVKEKKLLNMLLVIYYAYSMIPTKIIIKNLFKNSMYCLQSEI